MTARISILVLIGTSILSLAVAGCQRQQTKEPGKTPVASPAGSLASPVGDKPIPAFQIDLLESAFKAATAMPVVPHIKDRSLAQEAVVETCLKLDQPQRALNYTGRISDWRQGSAYADIAFYCVQHGHKEVQPLLDKAAKAAKMIEEWRRDHINVRIARTQALLGQLDKAAALEKDVDPSESGKVAAVKAAHSDEKSFDEQAKALDAAIATKNFDLAKNALEVYVGFFDRFYGDTQRRSLVEKKIKDSWNPMTLFVRIDLLGELVEIALKHGDQPKARALVSEAKAVKESAQWFAEDGLPIDARLASLRYRSGDKGNARSEMDAAMNAYEAQRAKIMNMDRAKTLCPLAEAYEAMGDKAVALAVYKRAVEEGAENPNSRPRALDLSATCSSMALHAIEPDGQLWKRIQQIREGLGNPW